MEIIATVITLLILGGGAYLFTKPQTPVNIPQKEEGTYEYFWGNGCPHCAKVAEFLDGWDKKDSIKLKKFEVWYDKNNAKTMEARYEACPEKPKKSDMAVPFMVTPDGKCLTGDGPIIDLFKSL